MLRLGYVLLGAVSLLFGVIGLFLPLLPTVPFVILAAFFFARGDPRVERWLVEHPRFGPHILAWRTRGAISRRGKRAALIAFTASALLGFLLLQPPWAFAPLAVAILGGTWISSRPEV